MEMSQMTLSGIISLFLVVCKMRAQGHGKLLPCHKVNITWRYRLGRAERLWAERRGSMPTGRREEDGRTRKTKNSSLISTNTASATGVFSLAKLVELKRICCRWAAIAQQMPGRSDNDIKNHWNSCLKKRLERNGIDQMTHQPIINLAVKIPSFNIDCGNSSSSTVSPSPSFSSSGSASLLNRLATGISSREHGVDRIKNILSDPRTPIITSQEEEFEESNKDHGKALAGDDQEDDFLMWDEENMRRFMDEIGQMDFETNGVYNSSSSSPLEAVNLRKVNKVRGHWSARNNACYVS
ncbi:hypothetical protein Bca4012_070950 [Brassica carinata]